MTVKMITPAQKTMVASLYHNKKATIWEMVAMLKCSTHTRCAGVARAGRDPDDD